MADKLTEICIAKREHIAKRRAMISPSLLLEHVRRARPARGFKQALRNTVDNGQIGLIAEIKKASPSKGLIRADFDPELLAQAYEKGGATCLSVLTDEPYFQGRDLYLPLARDAVDLPVLRKDFMLDPYQIAESRALGADCVLLIMAALGDAQARELEDTAYELGMDVLVEVHDRAELDRALAYLQPSLIGINNRSLKTLKVDISTSETLAKHIPASILGVCESGISTHTDVRRMSEAGLSCFLVGESLMREADVTVATRRLLGATA